MNQMTFKTTAHCNVEKIKDLNIECTVKSDESIRDLYTNIHHEYVFDLTVYPTLEEYITEPVDVVSKYDMPEHLFTESLLDVISKMLFIKRNKLTATKAHCLRKFHFKRPGKDY